jgi:hypothetical protein
LPGFFSPFPHGTGSLSVRSLCLALRDGPRRFRQSFTCSALLRYRLRVQIVFAYAAITLYGASSQRASANDWIGNSTVAGPTTPAGPRSTGFGLMRFRSPLLSQSRFLSFPSGTEMVHFPEFARTRLLNSSGRTPVLPAWVSPFGHPRVKACLRLIEAYRSLPRPSSPSSAKASTMRP